MDIVAPFIIIGMLGIVACTLATRSLPSTERDRLLRLLLIAFTLRMAAATMFALVPATRIFHEDSDGYEWLGMRLADYWHGEAPPLDLREGRGQNYGYYYVCGALYYVFGRFRPVVSYVNCVLGTIIVSFVYRLAASFFERVVANRAALLTALVPSMVLWSAMAMKDTLTSFLILLSLLGCIQLRKRISISSLSMTLIPPLAVQPIRFYLTYFMLISIVASLLLERGLGSVRGIYKPLLIGAAFIGLLMVAGLSSGLQQGAEFIDLEKVSAFRRGMSTTAQSGFADVDVSSPGRAIAFLPIGIANLLLSPFPWQFGSLRALFALPEMLVWWALIPATIRGLRFTIKTRWRETSPLLAFGGALTMAYSLIHGNVGSGFRQRAQIFIILFIFTSLGVYQQKCRRAQVDEKLLLLETKLPGPLAR